MQYYVYNCLYAYCINDYLYYVYTTLFTNLTIYVLRLIHINICMDRCIR